MTATVTILVEDKSAIGEARRLAVRVAERSGLSKADVGRVALVVTELATNLVDHARGGTLLIDGRDGGVVLLAIDRGPGMNITASLADGFSTRGTRGVGLGAIKRVADAFDIYADPTAGVALFARIGVAPSPGFESASVAVALASEDVCGDGCAVTSSRDVAVVFVVDGLGHGEGAHEASQVAIKAFHARAFTGPANFLTSIDPPMRKTRGAVAAVAAIDRRTDTLSYAGVGNIAGAIVVDGQLRTGLVSHGGTLGHLTPRVQEFSYPWQPGSTLVMHSDGISSRWNFANYPGLLARNPAVVAAVLFRDFAKERDDACVVVLRDQVPS